MSRLDAVHGNEIGATVILRFLTKSLSHGDFLKETLAMEEKDPNPGVDSTLVLTVEMLLVPLKNVIFSRSLMKPLA